MKWSNENMTKKLTMRYKENYRLSIMNPTKTASELICAAIVSSPRTTNVARRVTHVNNLVMI
jgi:hypothetical protein